MVTDDPTEICSSSRRSNVLCPVHSSSLTLSRATPRHTSSTTSPSASCLSCPPQLHAPHPRRHRPRRPRAPQPAGSHHSDPASPCPHPQPGSRHTCSTCCPSLSPQNRPNQHSPSSRCSNPHTLPRAARPPTTPTTHPRPPSQTTAAPCPAPPPRPPNPPFSLSQTRRPRPRPQPHGTPFRITPPSSPHHHVPRPAARTS